MFFACSGYLQYLFLFVDGDAILLTKDIKRGLRADQFYPALFVSSEMERYDPNYNVVIYYRDTAKYGASAFTETAVATDYFTKDGVFLEKKYARFISKTMDKFHRGA